MWPLPQRRKTPRSLREIAPPQQNTCWRTTVSNTQKLIAVVGATGQQGGAVARALQASGQFRVRALTRNPAKHPKLGDEVVLADFNRPETLNAAFAGAYGLFLVTNSWEAGADEPKHALAAVNAAKEASVQHFIWSTLPNVETISGGTIDVPHFTAKAKVERIVSEAGFVVPHLRDRAVLLPKPARRNGSAETTGWCRRLGAAGRQCRFRVELCRSTRGYRTSAIASYRP
jgi:NmrA-like family